MSLRAEPVVLLLRPAGATLAGAEGQAEAPWELLVTGEAGRAPAE